MSKSLPDPDTQKSPGWFIRCASWITGTDSEILASSPKRDRDQVVTIAIIQIAAFIWQTLVFTLAAHVMLARPGTIRPDLLAAALLLAGIIGLIDSYMIIRASWFLHGQEQLQRAGLVLPGSVATRAKNAFFVVVRVCMASVSSALVGTIFSILVFAKDVNTRLDAVYQARNGPLIEAVTRQYDHGTNDLERSRVQLEAQLAGDAGRSGSIGFSPIGPEAERIRASASRVASLETARNAAETTLRQAQTFATDELAGIRHDPRNSGVPGRGARRLAAEERRRQADDNLRTANHDLAVERKKLDDLRQSAATLARQQEQLAGPRLVGFETVRQQHLRELAGLDEKLAARLSARAAAIREAVEHDPSFRPRDDGLLARARALVMVAEEDPWTRSLIIALDLFLFIVELAAVIVKTTTFVPSAYACTLAKEESMYARRIAHEIAEYFNLLTSRRSIAKAVLLDDENGTDPDRNGAEGFTNGHDKPTAKRPRGRPRGQRTLPPVTEQPFDIRKPKSDDEDGLFGPDD